MLIAMPSGFTYGYTAGSGIANTSVDPDSQSDSIIGIDYFTTNSFFIDFSASTEGWK